MCQDDLTADEGQVFDSSLSVASSNTPFASSDWALASSSASSASSSSAAVADDWSVSSVTGSFFTSATPLDDDSSASSSTSGNDAAMHIVSGSSTAGVSRAFDQILGEPDASVMATGELLTGATTSTQCTGSGTVTGTHLACRDCTITGASAAGFSTDCTITIATSNGANSPANFTGTITSCTSVQSTGSSTENCGAGTSMSWKMSNLSNVLTSRDEDFPVLWECWSPVRHDVSPVETQHVVAGDDCKKSKKRRKINPVVYDNDANITGDGVGKQSRKRAHDTKTGTANGDGSSKMLSDDVDCKKQLPSDDWTGKFF